MFHSSCRVSLNSCAFEPIYRVLLDRYPCDLWCVIGRIVQWVKGRGYFIDPQGSSVGKWWSENPPRRRRRRRGKWMKNRFYVTESCRHIHRGGWRQIHTRWGAWTCFKVVPLPPLFSPNLCHLPIIRLQFLCSPIHSTTPKSRRLSLICNVGWLRRSTASALSCVIKTPTSRNGAAESSIRRDTNVVVGAFCFFSRFEMSVGDTLLSWLGITKTG